MSTLWPPGRAVIISLPQEVLEIIVNHLNSTDKVCFTCLLLHNRGVSCHFCGWALQGCTGVQGHLALCCKATLPIMGMGHVRIRNDEEQRGRPLLEATRCLTKQPGGVSHLEVRSRWKPTYYPVICQLMDLRCAHADIGMLVQLCCDMPVCTLAFVLPWPG